MTERIYHLIGQVKQSALEQKNAEISALEAQIDPHFLYNILDTINWKAIENEQYEISEMLVALAEILRYAINDAGELTTIEAEKVWLEKYILLQQEKLGEKIELIFKIPEELETYKIHKCCFSLLWKMRSSTVSADVRANTGLPSKLRRQKNNYI